MKQQQMVLFDSTAKNAKFNHTVDIYTTTRNDRGEKLEFSLKITRNLC